MADSSLCERPDVLADLLRSLFGETTASSPPGAAPDGRIAGTEDGGWYQRRNQVGRQAPSLLPPARVVSNPALGHDYLVIPIDRSTDGTGVSPGTFARSERPSDADIAELILAEQRARQTAETERDALADRIAQDFEELHWLRTLALTLSLNDVTADLGAAAQTMLAGLCRLVRAEAVALVPAAAPQLGSGGQVELARPDVVWSGESTVSPHECLDLVRQFQHLPTSRPVVFNRGAALRTIALVTTANNVLAVALTNGGRHFGWLIALNRVATADVAIGEEQAGRSVREFGSSEVGIMTTAAGMLAGQARNAELFQSEQGLRLGIIETVTGAVDARDPYTCGHSRRVAEMATKTAARLGFSAEQQRDLYITGLMHDVGKIGIRDDILKKPGRLTDEEFEIIKQHPTIGHSILAPLQGLSFVLPGVLHHHERIDGRGYPHGLQGDEIPLDARILAVADSYDAMTSDRAYRPGMPAEKAIAILNEGADSQWDGAIVDAFLGCTEVSC